MALLLRPETSLLNFMHPTAGESDSSRRDKMIETLRAVFTLPMPSRFGMISVDMYQYVH